MVTIRRGYWAAKVSGHNAAVRQQLERQTTGVNTTNGKVTWIVDPVNARGVPLIGTGPGAIRGTRPDKIAD